MELVQERQSKSIDHPDFAEFREAIRFIEEAPPHTIFFPEKFLLSLKGSTARHTRHLYEAAPDTPLLTVITKILSNINQHIPENMILEIIPVIINTWKKYQNQTVEIEEQELEPA